MSHSSSSLHPGSSTHPSVDQITATAQRLSGKVLRTPVWRWHSDALTRLLGEHSEIWLKLELFQKTGSFKVRGALNSVDALDAAARQRGVVAVSAGNHAIAVSCAAMICGVPAVVVMPAHASPVRIAACREFGAEVLLAADIHAAFEQGTRIQTEQGRTMIHPYDGPLIAQGTATVGLELAEQVAQLDAVVVPVGGGGLIGGVAAAIKQLRPECAVYGVEPVGADAMARSFAAGAPARLDRIASIADSLGAPFALEYSYGLCRRFVDEIVRVDDDDICRAMYWLYRDMKLVAEPAAATATAALIGPLRQRLRGRRVGVLVCGSNIDAVRFAELVGRGQLLDEAALNAEPRLATM